MVGLRGGWGWSEADIHLQPRERDRLKGLGRMRRGWQGSVTSGTHRVGVRVKWGGTSAIEGPGIVFFPWSATPFFPPPKFPSWTPTQTPRTSPPTPISRGTLSLSRCPVKKGPGRLSFTPQGRCVFNELIQMKKFNTMDGLPQPK